MQNNSIEARYYSPQTGYVTEEFRGTSAAGVIALLKARVGPEVRIEGLTCRSAPAVPPTPPTDPNRRGW